MTLPVQRNGKVQVVLFSGGRGSRVLSTELIRNPSVKLTLAINGYDDGASTGEIRRFLGDSLGPSDFRKNASRMARGLQSCPESLIDLLDFRFPKDCSFEEGFQTLTLICNRSSSLPLREWQVQLQNSLNVLDSSILRPVTESLSNFRAELQIVKRPFSFSDCSLGNLVFAGCFLGEQRKFNRGIARYCSILHLIEDLILNVTDGKNAFLVALDRENRVLGSEAEIVDASKRNFILDLFLIDRRLEDGDQAYLQSPEQISEFMEQHSAKVVVNHDLLERIAKADIIIYSPGTQHSSLFPSYITPGLGSAIGKNLTAIKLLVTNVQEDAEIPENSAVDLIEKAVRYLKEKNRLHIPTPCLITHYLINDPRETSSEAPYIPLGRLETLEDPRLIRIGDYEDGVTVKIRSSIKWRIEQ